LKLPGINVHQIQNPSLRNAYRFPAIGTIPAYELKGLLNYKDIPIYEIPPAIVVLARPKVLGLGFFA